MLDLSKLTVPTEIVTPVPVSSVSSSSPTNPSIEPIKVDIAGSQIDVDIAPKTIVIRSPQPPTITPSEAAVGLVPIPVPLPTVTQNSVVIPPVVSPTSATALAIPATPTPTPSIITPIPQPSVPPSPVASPTVVTAAPLLPFPVPPTGLNTTAQGQTSFELHWNPVPGAEFYKLFKNTTVAGQTTTNSYALSGLEPDTTYDMQLSTGNALGESAKSQVLQVKTLPLAVQQLDNQTLVFTSNRDGNRELYLMKIDGSGLVRLTNNAVDDTHASFSPDRKQILFNSNNRLALINVDGSGFVDLAAPFGFAWAVRSGSLSPNGQKIVFVTDGPGKTELFTANKDSTERVRLTDNNYTEAYPSWSPDGSKIAFVLVNSRGAIYVMNSDGSSQTRLTEHTYDSNCPVWSPDNTKLAFNTQKDGNSEIYTMNADGSNLFNVTQHPAQDECPTWSPDGSQLVFSSLRDTGHAQLYVIKSDGSGLSRISNNSYDDILPTWFRK